MFKRLLPILFLAACTGGTHYDGLDGGDSDAATDALVSTDGTVDAGDTIDAPPGVWSALAPLPVNTANETETNPQESPDEFTLFFVGVRADKIGSLDVNYTTRSSPTAAFNAGHVTLFSLDTAASDEIEPFVSPDYLELYFVRDGNLLVSKRATLVDGWPAPTDTTIDGAKPVMSEDGLALYYADPAASCPVQTCRSKRTRATTSGNWGAPVVESFPPGNYQNVYLSNDGLRVLLSGPVNGNTTYALATASRMMKSAARSFTEAAGFCDSSLAQIVAIPGSMR